MHWATFLLCAVLATAAETDEARRLRAAVTFLAADELEGRGTPSRGLDIAALYLENELRGAGVLPAAGDSYRQAYTAGTYQPAKAKVTVRIDGRTIEPPNYVFLNFGWDPARGALSLPLIDVGEGVVAEDKNVNQLAGLDLRSKAAVARKGAPWKLDPAAVFGPDRAIGKTMAAAVRGAAMLIYLSADLDQGSEAEQGFLREMKNAPVAFLREPSVSHVSALVPILVLKPPALRGHTAGKIEIHIEAPVEIGRAANVLGRIEGTDPALKNEWVLLSAHYDHIGFHAAPLGKDGIWNGADDNASGTAGVLEMARQLVRQPSKRSVLVFFTSGEDRGIFGSAYYGAHPVVPMKQVAVQLNLDMIGRPRGRVQAIAPVSPPLYEEAVRLGRKHAIEVVPDQQPTWRVLYLTDNYHFARAAVPGIFFFTGVHEDYHQPTDTADKLDYEGMARIVALALEMAREYTAGKPRPAFDRPRWFVTP